MTKNSSNGAEPSTSRLAPLRSVILGGGLSLVAVLIALYSSAMIWGARTGVLVGVDLAAISYRSVTPAWPIAVSAGVLIACLVVAMTTVPRVERRTTYGVAGVTGLAVLVAAILIRQTAPDTLVEQELWQRAGWFLSESDLLPVFTAVSVIAFFLARGRQPRSEAAT